MICEDGWKFFFVLSVFVYDVIWRQKKIVFLLLKWSSGEWASRSQFQVIVIINSKTNKNDERERETSTKQKKIYEFGVWQMVFIRIDALGAF